MLSKENKISLIVESNNSSAGYIDFFGE